MIDFAEVTNKFLKEKDFLYDENVKYVRGIACVNTNEIFINTKCSFWRECMNLGEEFLIEEIIKTMVHEFVHILIGTGDKKPVNYTYEGEEEVCSLMAGQTYLGLSLVDIEKSKVLNSSSGLQ